MSVVSNCWIWCRRRRVWSAGPTLNQQRGAHGCVRAAQSIFVLGGGSGDGIRDTASIERLPDGATEWSQLGVCLPEARSNFGCASLISDQHSSASCAQILIAGGLHSSFDPVASVMLFDGAADGGGRFIDYAPLNVARETLCATALLGLEGIALLTGGAPREDDDNAAQPLPSCELFDRRLPDMAARAPLPHELSFHAALAATEHELLTLGGSSHPGNSNIPHIQRYDIRADRWAVLTARLPVPISGLCCAML